MKEATGELNVTVIVAISVGILSAFFFGVMWPAIRGNFKSEASCQKATCNCDSGIRDAHDGKCECFYYDKGEASNVFYCPFGG